MEGRAQLWHLYLGTDYRGFKVYSYAAGTTTVKDIWADPEKTTPIVGYDGDGNPTPALADNNGWIAFFADGEYRFDITTADDILIRTLDPIRITADAPHVWEGSHGTVLPAADTLNKYQTFVKHSVGGSFQGMYYQSGDAFTQIDGSIAGNGIYVSTYGAVGNGVADDTAAIRAAIAAATPITTNRDDPRALGSIVFFPPGVYLISDQIDIPGTVSLRGIGQVRITTNTADQERLFSVEGEYGEISGFYLDGNEYAKIGLYVDLAVQRIFRNITARYCTDAGGVINMTQNCYFDSCDFEDNDASTTYGGNLRLNNGAGNNVFTRCELSNGVPYNLVILHNSAADARIVSDGYNASGPSGNLFTKCVIERTPAGQVNNIYMRGGRNNCFLNCEISSTGYTTATDQIYLTAEDCAHSAPIFYGCRIQGTTAYTTAFKIGAGVWETLIDACGLNNHAVAFDIASTARTFVSPTCTYGGVTSTYSDRSPEHGFHVFKSTWEGATSATHMLESHVDGEDHTRFQVATSGVIEWGPGTDVVDTQIYRYDHPGGTPALQCSVPWTIQGTTAAVLAGAGTPEGAVTAKIGSIYLNTSGGAGTTLYVKQSGDNTNTGWVGK